MVPEDELDACPWACALEVAGDHVIMAIQLEQAPKIIGQIVSLAAQLELVRFDPQAGKVYLPPRLENKPGRRRRRSSLYFRVAAISNPARWRTEDGQSRSSSHPS
jgi:hypothetical protein